MFCFTPHNFTFDAYRTSMKLEDKIKETIRDVKDFPTQGIVFKDITPVLANAALLREIIKSMVESLKHERIDAVAAVEARGFIIGAILAYELNCRFIPIRKAGKLPYKTKAQEYALEYGSASVEIHIDAVEPGCRVLVHDDLLATGGTAAAAAALIKSLGAELVGFNFLVNLSFLPGEKKLMDLYGIKPQYQVRY